MLKIGQIISARNTTLERIGNALMFIGSVAILSLLVIVALSMPNVSRGWEYVWFLPRLGFIYFLMFAVALLVFGLILRFVPKFIKR
jgi:hypothetical protein